MCVRVGPCYINVKILQKRFFQIGYLNGHLFGKELLIQFTVRVFRERLSMCVYMRVCVLLSFLVLRVRCAILLCY